MRYRPSTLRRLLLWFGSTRFGTWVILSLCTPFDRVLFGLTRGRFSTTSLILPSLILISTGAKTGLPRSTPLVFIPDAERMILIASNGGQPRHPAWYHNLCANPEAQILFRGRTRRCLSYEAKGVEREELWHQAVAAYPGYAVYQRRTQGRVIPVMVLEPIP
ncbi:MAG: nitroreductase family deazaflavin-dependent oxidoreductase [Oscillochloris sp.]|nr:nitroreductase family deazaflavin-dependent oxidoreductase [Oscillochloris sp.]